jgi:selenocysteine-specific elongation factor
MAARTAPLQVTIGTAGHVDHGKTSLVEALTGVNPDRLPEEKRRGLTIELGFAFLPGEAGIDLAFIDCPGHERFVHHMVAGAGSMEGCLLIVAANEGPCAQTREHLDILRLLGLRWGRVILTKADLMDAAGLAAAAELANELVAGTPFAAEPPLAVSAHDGRGLPELKRWLFERAAEQRRQTSGVHARLPVDRVFSLAGHGTVVTGTLLSGELSPGDEVCLHPGGKARVRSLQVNRISVDRAVAGQRTAVNLVGIERDQVKRGAWLATPDTLQASREVDVRLDVLALGLKHRAEVLVHHGTTHVTARVHLLHADLAEGGCHDAQLRLDEELFLRAGDRLVLRRPSPAANLAGAVVVDAAPPHHRRFSDEARAWFAARTGRGTDALLAWLGGSAEPPTASDAEAWAGGPAPLAAAVAAAGPLVLWRQVGASRRLWASSTWAALADSVLAWLGSRLAARSEQPWIGQEDLRAAVAARLSEACWLDLLGQLDGGGRIARREGRVTVPALIGPLPERLRAAALALWRIYDAAGLEPPYDHPCWAAQPDPELAALAHRALAERGWLLRLNDRQHLHRRHAERLATTVRAAVARGPLGVGAAKSDLGLPRKYVIPYLEWCDAIGLTRRAGDARIAGPHDRLTIPTLGEPPT